MATLIPARHVMPVVNSYIDARGISLEELSMQLGYEKDLIRKADARGRMRWELVDEILAKTGAFLLWYEEPLKSYYYEGQTPPPDRAKPIPCQNPECDEWFELKEPRKPGQRWGARVYCCRSCQQTHRLRKMGVQSKKNPERCRRGHVYAEHGYRNKHGKLVCRRCRAINHRNYHQKPEVKIATAARLREYRRRQKEIAA